MARRILGRMVRRRRNYRLSDCCEIYKGLKRPGEDFKETPVECEKGEGIFPGQDEVQVQEFHK